MPWFHYNDIIMSAMASQITSHTTICSTVYSGADQRKHQSSASLAFLRGIHRWPMNSPHKGAVTRKIVSIGWRHHVKFSCMDSFLELAFLECRATTVKWLHHKPICKLTYCSTNIQMGLCFILFRLYHEFSEVLCDLLIHNLRSLFTGTVTTIELPSASEGYE